MLCDVCVTGVWCVPCSLHVALCPLLCALCAAADSLDREDSEKLWIPSGVIGIVISWFVSPILSAIIAVGLFSFVRKFILRSKNAFRCNPRLELP